MVILVEFLGHIGGPTVRLDYKPGPTGWVNLWTSLVEYLGQAERNGDQAWSVGGGAWLSW